MTDSYSIKAKWMIDKNFNTLKDQHIIIEDTKISYIGNYNSSEIPQGSEHIEYTKGLVVPPFINAHTHIPETLIRGLIDDVSLQEWLYEHVWRVEPMMKPNDARIGTQLGIAEMFSTGTIGFNDQYFFADEIAKVVIESGAKATLGPSIFDQGLEFDTAEEALSNNIALIKKWHGRENRIFIGFGPHAPYTVQEDMLLRIYEEAERYDTFIHTHLHETRKEVDQAIDKNGMTAITRLNSIGIMNRVRAAHCVHVDTRDRQILLDNNVTILHNPQSNLKIGSGIAPIPEYLDFGLNVTIGTDGNASNNNLDMLEEVRLTAMIHKGLNLNPKLIDAKTALKLATQNASSLFPDGVYSGKLEVGQPADLIVIDQNRINMTPVINPLSNWIFSSTSDNVVLTMSNGKLVYQDNELLTLDRDKIMDSAQRSTDRMMQDADYTAIEFHT